MIACCDLKEISYYCDELVAPASLTNLCNTIDVSYYIQTWGQFNFGIDGQFWNCLFKKKELKFAKKNLNPSII